MDIDSFLENEGKGQQSEPAKDAPKEGQKGDGEGTEAEPRQEPAGIDGRINELKELMAKKQYEEVERKYIEAKELFADMQRRQQEEHNRIYNELENINREMVNGLHMLRQETERKIGIINELILKAQERLSNNELDTANKLYAEIDTLFKSLSDVMPDQKLKLEQDITRLHVELSSKTNMAANQEFHTKFSNIRNLLSFAMENVRRGNMNDAVQMYNRINSLYEELPKGFLYEKAMLYREILRLFKAINHKPDQPMPPPAQQQAQGQPQNAKTATKPPA